MGVPHNDKLVLADGALAEAVLSGSLPLGEATAAGALTLAWSLKHACEEHFLGDPGHAARAAKLLAELALGADEAALPALADWAAGLAHLAQAEPQLALAPLERAAAAWQQQAQALYAAQVQALRLKALVQLGRFDDADQHAAGTESRLAALGDGHGAALLRLLRADLCLQRQQPDAAAAFYQDAAERLARLDDAEHALIAEIGRADALVACGHVVPALQAFLQAERQAQRHGLPALAAAAQHGLALLNLAQGHHRAGLQGLGAALQAFDALGLAAQHTAVLRDLAAHCLALRLLPEALAHHRVLVQRLQGHGDAPALPWVHLHHAQALAAAGKASAARSALGWARALFLQRGLGLGTAHVDLAILALDLAATPAPTPAEATRHAAQARALQAELPAPQRAQARLLQVRAHRLAGNGSAALAGLPLLCGPQGQASAPGLQAQAWVEAGQAHLAHPAHRAHPAQAALSPAPAHGKAAAAAFEQAISRFDDLQAALPGVHDGLSAADAAPLAQQLACDARLALAVAHGAPGQVLQWLHLLRQRQLSQRLGADTSAAGQDTLARARSEALRVQRNWCQRRWQRCTEDGHPSLAQPWLAAWRQAEQQLLDTTRRTRRARHSGSATLAGADEALDLAALCRHFRHGRALVVYAELKSLADCGAAGTLLAVVVADGCVQLQHTATGFGPLREAVQGLRAHLDTQGLDDAALAARAPQMLARCTQRLQALHQRLWAPLQDCLAGATDVVVVPCDGLQALPFAALHDGQQWLDERCRLRLAATPALALLPPAPAALLSPAPAADGPPPGLLHVAGAAQLRHDNPAFSELLLADGRRLCPADLQCQPELQGQPHRASLAVLETSDTQRLRTAQGDEQLALVLALQRAGVAEVVDMLWPLRERDSRLALDQFNLARSAFGHDNAAALQQARAALRALHPHPSVWAALCLYGGQAAQAGRDDLPTDAAPAAKACKAAAEPVAGDGPDTVSGWAETTW